MTTVTKDEFLAEVQQAYTVWQTALDQITPEQMCKPMPPGQWAIKDVIAHITWHEREMIGMLSQRALVGSEYWALTLDERNHAIYEAYKDQSLDETLKAAAETHAALKPLLEALTTEELNNARCFAQMPAEWAPWDVIASNTSRHYRDHAKDIQNQVSE